MDRQGDGEHPRIRRSVISYRMRPEGPYVAYNPMIRVRRQCECWRTHAYPDHVVLLLYHERRRLTRINRELRKEIDRCLAMEEA